MAFALIQLADIIVPAFQAMKEMALFVKILMNVEQDLITAAYRQTVPISVARFSVPVCLVILEMVYCVVMSMNV